MRPYCDSNTSFSDLIFRGPDGVKIQTDVVQCPHQDLGKWYLNLGSWNKLLINLALLNPKLTKDRQDDGNNYYIPVLLLDQLFKDHLFRFGDEIIFTVKDYHRGHFSISVLKSSPKSFYKFRSTEFQHNIESSIIEEINYSGVYPLAYQALIDCYARLKHSKKLEHLAPLAWSRYLKKSAGLKLLHHNHEVVIYNGALTVAKQTEILQELSWPVFKTENLSDLLCSLNFDIEPATLSALAQRFIAQASGDHNDFFQDIFQRFGISPVPEEIRPIFDWFTKRFWQDQQPIANIAEGASYRQCRLEALELYETVHQIWRCESFAEGNAQDKLELLQTIMMICELTLSKLHEQLASKEQVEIFRRTLKNMSENIPGSSRQSIV